jgi:hypothetical protein
MNSDAAYRRIVDLAAEEARRSAFANKLVVYEKFVTDQMRGYIRALYSRALDVQSTLDEQDPENRLQTIEDKYCGRHNDYPGYQKMTLEQIYARENENQQEYKARNSLEAKSADKQSMKSASEQKKERQNRICLRNLPLEWQEKLHSQLMMLHSDLSGEDASQMLFCLDSCDECELTHCPLQQDCESFNNLLIELSYHFERIKWMSTLYNKVRTCNEWLQTFWHVLMLGDIKAVNEQCDHHRWPHWLKHKFDTYKEKEAKKVTFIFDLCFI